MMQLELIGCTGAGKSTLAGRLFEAAHCRGMELFDGDQVVLERFGWTAAASGTWRASLIHAATLSVCLRHGGRYADFLSVARQALRSSGIPQRRQWGQLRKVLKQLGRYELIRRLAERDGWTLVDEGTLQAAHNLFVHVGYQLNDEQLRRFTECVPLPEVAVYLRPSEQDLVERTLRRGHPRIARPTPRTVARFVRQALEAFDRVTCHERIAGRTIVIEQGTIVRAPAGSATPLFHSVFELVTEALVVHGTTARHEDTAHRASVMI